MNFERKYYKVKKKAKTSDPKPQRAQLYAIFNHQSRLIRKVMIKEYKVRQYLNDKALEGKSYYAILLNGLSRKLSAKELKPLENLIVNQQNNLDAYDHKELKALLRVLKTKPAREGMIKAHKFDTFLRDEIPSDIWKKMGGETSWSYLNTLLTHPLKT